VLRHSPPQQLTRAVAQVYKLTTSDSPSNLRFVQRTAWAMRETINGKRWLRDDVDALRPRLALLLQKKHTNSVALQASRDLEWAVAGALPDGDLRLRLGEAEYMAEHSGGGNRWVEARFQVCCEGADGRLHAISKEAAAHRSPVMADTEEAVAGEALARSVADAEASSVEGGRGEESSSRMQFPDFEDEGAVGGGEEEGARGLQVWARADGTCKEPHLTEASLVWLGNRSRLL